MLRELPVSDDILTRLLYIVSLIMANFHSIDTQLIYSAITFLLKYYKDPKNKEKDYLTILISSLHLSSKVCEHALTISGFQQSIEIVKKDPNFIKCVKDVCKEDLDSPDFTEKFIKNIEKSEMDLITTLNFDFTVTNPRDLAFTYIERGLSWHFPMNLRELAYFIQTDCYIYINKLLSELLLNPTTFKIEDKVLSLIIAQLTLDHFNMPVNIDLGRSLNKIFLPKVDDKEYQSIEEDLNFYILDRWKNIGHPFKEMPTLQIDMEYLQKFVVYPIEFGSNEDGEPNCPPPDFPLLKSFFKDDKSTIYTNSYADHIPDLPPFPMPQYGDEVPPLPKFNCLSLSEYEKRKRDRYDRWGREPYDYHQRDKYYRPPPRRPSSRDFPRYYDDDPYYNRRPEYDRMYNDYPRRGPTPDVFYDNYRRPPSTGPPMPQNAYLYNSQTNSSGNLSRTSSVDDYCPPNSAYANSPNGNQYNAYRPQNPQYNTPYNQMPVQQQSYQQMPPPYAPPPNQYQNQYPPQNAYVTYPNNQNYNQYPKSAYY